MWTLLTEAKHLGRWFGDAGARVDLRPGGDMLVSWSRGGDRHAVVETVQPPWRFAFRWAHPAGEAPRPGNSTLVEFTLQADGSGTLLRVVETGFASLDAEHHGAFDGNQEGWRRELAELREYAS